MSAREAFASLQRVAGDLPLATPRFSGDDPVVVTPFRVAAAAAASLGLGASAAEALWRVRGGAPQDVAIDVRAAAASLVSFALLRLDGKPVPRPSENKPTVALYPTKDGRWFHLHGGFPHLERGVLDVIGADNTVESVAAKVAEWKSFALEDELARRNLCGAVMRSRKEWLATAQGAALANAPPVALRRIGDAPRLDLAKADRPLEGIRVLDLTRVLAGPTAGRTLASYGAEVLCVRHPGLPTIDVFDLDTGLGKRSTYLDLSEPDARETFRDLLRSADVIVDSYRPGALAKLGFSAEEIAEIAPGIVHVAVSCYGHQGPWAGRRGWEQLAQTATGLAVEQTAFNAARNGTDAAPRIIPAAACDYTTGYLAAAGATLALLKRADEGGSWRVEVSLCATAIWLRSLGLIDAAEVPESWNPLAGLDGYFQSCETAQGHLDHLGPVVRMSRTQPAWHLAPPECGADEPRWSDGTEK